MSANFSRFLVKFHTYLIVLWYLSRSCNQGPLYTHFSSTQTSLFPASSCVHSWQLNPSSKSHSTSGVRPSFRTDLVTTGFSHSCSTASAVHLCGPVLEFCEVKKFVVTRTVFILQRWFASQNEADSEGIHLGKDLNQLDWKYAAHDAKNADEFLRICSKFCDLLSSRYRHNY